MKNVDIFSHKQRIDHVVAQINSLPDDYAIRSHWAKYICVLVSGFLEKSVQTLCNEYAKNKASPKVAHFVGRHIERFQNAKMEKILSLLQSFDPKFQIQIENETHGQLADAVNSVVSNRHQIAHGANVGMSPASIINWYKSIVTVIEKIENVLS